MAKTVIGCIIFLVIIVALGAALHYLYVKYSEYREYKGKVVSVGDHVTIITGTLEPGSWCTVIVEEENGEVHSYVASANFSDQLVVGQEYTFYTVNGKLVDAVKVE